MRVNREERSWGEVGKYVRVNTGIISLHHTPVPPLEDHGRRTTIYLQHLPCERRHHPFKSFMTRCQIQMFRAVEFIRARDDGIISSDFEHVLTRLGRRTVHGKGVRRGINGTPGI